MSPDTSPSAGRRRKFTPAFLAKATQFYKENGWQATAKKFHLSGNRMQKIRAAALNGQSPTATGITSPDRTGRSLYLAAKALEKALMRHRQAGSPPSDIEHYAFFLLKEILK